jgi:hypothetical protein
VRNLFVIDADFDLKDTDALITPGDCETPARKQIPSMDEPIAYQYN